jgi:hypothetical protein
VTRWLLFGPIVIVAFDAVASGGARALDFDYAALWPVPVVLYSTIGFLAARERGSIRVGIATGATVALADATVGWAISWIIGPGAPDVGDRDALALIGTAVVVIGIGALGGAVGGWLGVRAARQPA